MTKQQHLIPREKTPDLDLPLVGGGNWRLSEQNPENFTMLVVYRGLHCPICSLYLADLNNKIGQFKDKGVKVVVASSDDEARAAEAKEKWELDKLDVAYGMTLDQGREWGLYVSAGIGKTSVGVEEPEQFLEPGLFIMKPDQTLYFASIQTMPFARPTFSDVLKAIDIALEKDYPARGEIAA